jgi:hypothetical protein
LDRTVDWPPFLCDADSSWFFIELVMSCHKSLNALHNQLPEAISPEQINIDPDKNVDWVSMKQMGAAANHA